MGPKREPKQLLQSWIAHSYTARETEVSHVQGSKQQIGGIPSKQYNGSGQYMDFVERQER